jgi:hypothetical protein
VILLQSSLPCSENFFRYKKNYEKFVNSGPKSQENSPKNSDGSRTQPVEVKKSIASPKILSKFSPIASMMNRQKLTVNTGAMNALMKYSMNTNA